MNFGVVKFIFLKKKFTCTKILLCIFYMSYAQIDKKHNIITLYSEEWGFLTYYTPIVSIESDSWFFRLSENLRKIDQADFPDSLYSVLSIENMNLAKRAYSLSKYKMAKAPKIYTLLDTTLFLWMNSDIYTCQQSSWYQYVKQHPKYVPSLFTAKRINNKAFEKNNLEIKDKYDALASFVVAWNAVRYFSAHPIGQKNDWKWILEDYIPKFLSIETKQLQAEYFELMHQMIGYIRDAHSLRPIINRYKFYNRNLISVTTVDSFTVVNKIMPSVAEKYDLHVGAILLRKDGELIDSVRKKIRPYMLSSNEGATNMNINRAILYFDPGKDTLTMTVKTNDSYKKDIKLSILDNYYMKYNDTISASIKPINDSIVYISLHHITSALFCEALEKFKNKKYFILDFRKYPQNIEYDGTWSKYLVQKKGIMFYRLVLREKYPGLYLSDSIWLSNFPDKKKYYKSAREYCTGKKFYFIANEETQSKGEGMLQAMRLATNGKIFGRATAGVTSPVSGIVLPYNLRITFSTYHVYDHQKRLISGCGIIPDVIIPPSLELIQKGRDEILEAVLQFICKENRI